jgi:predicted ATPase
MLQWVRGMISAPLYCRRFIGRKVHLDMLDERYAAAVAGQGSIVLIAAEAGLGKSRLAAEFVSVARTPQSPSRAVGLCFEFAQSPFGPFIDALRALHAQTPQTLSSAGDLTEALGQLLPELRNSPAQAEAADKREQLNAVAEALRRFGVLRPAIVVIEDLHWADRASLEFLQYASRVIAASRLLLVATYRPEELKREHPLRSTLAKLEPHPSVWTVRLEPLGDAETQALMRDALAGRDRVDPETLAAICARAEGNPLFAEKLLKAAIDGKAAEELPLSVRETVHLRLAELNDGERSVLVHAAAIGRRFEPDLLAEIVEQPLRDVLAVLKRAVDAQLIVEEPGDIVRYAFRHALTQAAVYGELLAAEASNIACPDRLPDRGAARRRSTSRRVGVSLA